MAHVLCWEVPWWQQQRVMWAFTKIIYIIVFNHLRFYWKLHRKGFITTSHLWYRTISSFLEMIYDALVYFLTHLHKVKTVKQNGRGDVSKSNGVIELRVYSTVEGYTMRGILHW